MNDAEVGTNVIMINSSNITQIFRNLIDDEKTIIDNENIIVEHNINSNLKDILNYLTSLKNLNDCSQVQMLKITHENVIILSEEQNKFENQLIAWILFSIDKTNFDSIRLNFINWLNESSHNYKERLIECYRVDLFSRLTEDQKIFLFFSKHFVSNHTEEKLKRKLIHTGLKKQSKSLRDELIYNKDRVNCIEKIFDKMEQIFLFDDNTLDEEEKEIKNNYNQLEAVAKDCKKKFTAYVDQINNSMETAKLNTVKFFINLQKGLLEDDKNNNSFKLSLNIMIEIFGNNTQFEEAVKSINKKKCIDVIDDVENQKKLGFKPKREKTNFYTPDLVQISKSKNQSSYTPNKKELIAVVEKKKTVGYKKKLTTLSNDEEDDNIQANKKSSKSPNKKKRLNNTIQEEDINELHQNLLQSILFPKEQKFVVLENAFSIDDEDDDIINKLVECLHQHENLGNIIVQHADCGEIKAHNDNNRLFFIPDNMKNKLSEKFFEMLSIISKRIDNLVKATFKQQFESSKVSILFSKAGCEKQDLHTDFPIDTDNSDSMYTKNSYFAIVSLMEGTSIGLEDNSTIAIGKGSFFFGRGDLIHCGSNYVESNVRLHYYFDHKDLSSAIDPRNTYFVDLDNKDTSSSTEKNDTNEQDKKIVRDCMSDLLERIIKRSEQKDLLEKEKEITLDDQRDKEYNTEPLHQKLNDNNSNFFDKFVPYFNQHNLKELDRLIFLQTNGKTMYDNYKNNNYSESILDYKMISSSRKGENFDQFKSNFPKYLDSYRATYFLNVRINMFDFLGVIIKGEWLTSYIIDIYFVMLNFREISLLDKFQFRKKSYFFNSNIIKSLFEREIEMEKSLFVNGKNILDYENLYLPALYHTIHWILVEIILLKDEKKIHINMYDSLNKNNNFTEDHNKIANSTKNWIEKELQMLKEDIKNYSFEIKMGLFPIQQGNFNDCGIYTLIHATLLPDKILENKSVAGKLKKLLVNDNARKKIALDIERAFILDPRLEEYYKIEKFQFDFFEKKFNSTIPSNAALKLCSCFSDERTKVGMQSQRDLLNMKRKNLFDLKKKLEEDEKVLLQEELEIEKQERKKAEADGSKEL